MLIDTHAHLNFAAYKKDLDEVIKRALDNNLWVINVGSKYETSKRAVEIAERYKEGVYAAIGLHPIYSTAGLVKTKTDPEEGNFTAREEDFDKEKYRKLAKSEKVVAIGEIGLDYYYRPKTKRKLELFKEKQKEVFIEQLGLAKELKLPIIFHCRVAHNDLIQILRKFQSSSFKFQGVVHCFTGNWEQAREYLDMGFYIGFNGIIYKLDLDEIIKKTPLERILIETDCPYLTPPEAGEKRNEPIFVKYIAEKITKIKNIDYEKITESTTINARKLFGI
jgi:TatD DNase family protein